MAFEKEKKEYEVIKEGQEDVLKINAESWTFTPSIEDNNLVMAYVIDKLIEVPSANRIVFVQRRNYVYDYNQVQLLLEIANIYKILTRQKRALSITSLGFREDLLGYFSSKYMLLQDLIFNLLRNDPIGAYVELKRLIRGEKITQKKLSVDFLEYENRFMELLKSVYDMLEKTKLVNLVKDEIAGYKLGDRGLYKLVFRPAITPDFIFTRLMVQPPLNGEELDIYSVDNTDITIFSIPEDIKPLYHMNPPEFKISEDKYELLDLARTVMAEHKPKEEEFLDPERMRTTFFNIGRDLIQELAEHRNINLNIEELNDLTNILVRYTVGFGLVELLLKDPKIQDISINGPVGQSPIFIVHEDFSECATNIIPSLDDAESWASKFRILSGRPLDEANPVLDTELIIPGSRARVAIIQKPLNPYGLGFSLRRHRDNPWTFPLFIKNRMMNPLAAGLLSFLIDGARSILFCGTRSSGKTSLLGASLVEIMRKYRIISIEDTLELPTEALRQLGYNIQAMKVRSALTKGGVEVPADEGIRTSLRMGDSSLIVGEIRSLEAFALYEAMRIGALANVVAGTIHGDSPYGVFDRVVNDLKVPKTSFKATDIIVISNPVRSADGLHKWRRILSITEVRKGWEEDPLKENGFVDLMKYDPEKDELIPTDDLINGDSDILKSIAGNVKEWAGNWDSLWANILLRTKIKQYIVDYVDKSKRNQILEAPFVIASNDAFHRISDKVNEEKGRLDYDTIFGEWELWFKKEVKLLS